MENVLTFYLLCLYLTSCALCVRSNSILQNAKPNVGGSWREDDTEENIRLMHADRMTSYMNTSVDPCEDFYEYACGNWENVYPIPNDRVAFNVFSLLHNNVMRGLREVLESKADSQAKDNDAEAKARLFYSTCMDEKTIALRGSDPLFEHIDQLGGWPVLEEAGSEKKEWDLLNLAVKTNTLGETIIWDANVDFDLKNSTRFIIYITEPSLGLMGNRENYLSADSKHHLDAYRNLIVTTLRLLEVDPEKSDEVAKEIVDFETQLANITSDTKQLHLKWTELYTTSTIDELNKQYPSIDWLKYLNGVLGKQLDKNTTVVVLASQYYSKLTDLLGKFEKRVIANYMVWRSVRTAMTSLDERFRAALQVYIESLMGQKVLPDRWEECVSLTSAFFDKASGAMFVRNYFSESSRDNVVNSTEDLKKSFMESLQTFDWLDKNTKALAIEKINKTRLAVGFPDFIVSKEKLNKYYDGIRIEKGKYSENFLNIERFLRNRKQNRLDEVVDKDEWPTSPTTVNAMFEQAKNRIVIPTGILQPPMYHRHFPQALNYGGMGAIIGHELTHSLDAVGRQFDLYGNWNEWFGNDSIAHFQEKSECFINQYGKFSFNGTKMNGEISISENIADNGAVSQAFAVYSDWLGRNKGENERLPDMDFSPEQLFFLAFAQAWCTALRPETIESKLQTDNHSLERFRVIGSLSNFDEFSKAFQCPIGSSMNPVSKCKLW